MSDLISREALLKAMEEERQYLLARGQTGAEHILVHHCLPLIDNAPRVDLITPTIKVNIPEETKQKLIEELQKPHKLLVLPEPEVTFERVRGEWGKWVISEIQCPNCFEYFETDCYSTEELKKCPNCGADMRKGGES